MERLTIDGLERLYREDGERLWRAVFAYAGNRDVADDAVAEAFTQAIGRGDELRDEGTAPDLGVRAEGHLRSAP